MRVVCWITKATNTYSEYVILTAFPLEHCLHERASMLRYSTLPVLLILGLELYMPKYFNPHLGNFQAIILHRIDYNLMLPLNI
jgi:hypothetical protein